MIFPHIVFENKTNECEESYYPKIFVDFCKFNEVNKSYKYKILNTNNYLVIRRFSGAQMAIQQKNNIYWLQYLFDKFEYLLQMDNEILRYIMQNKSHIINVSNVSLRSSNEFYVAEKVYERVEMLSLIL